MSESFTETNKISYGENIKNSFGGMVAGLLIFLASFVVLWTNEGHNVAQIDKANYINKTAIEITADEIDRANDNKLVQVSGNAVTDATLTDGIITVPNAFALERKVEMYQWDEDVKTEEKDELGGGTTEKKTYTYDKVWSSTPIDSSKFKKTSYANPPFTVKSANFYAKTGKLGEFNLTQKQSKAMSEFSEYENLPQKSEYKIYDHKYYKGNNPENPNIGDLRVSYEYVPSDVEISVVAQQRSNNTLANMAYKESTIYLQQSGLKSKGEMVNSFRKSNKIITNLVRIGGWLLMFWGLTMLISPLVVLTKVIPFISHILGALSNGVLLIISLVLSLLTISIAWFAYRPFRSVSILLVIGGIIFLFKDKFIHLKDKQQ